MVCISSTAAILGYCVVAILLGHNVLTRAAGSNLWMGRPSLMSVVKLVMIHVRSAWQILVLAFSSQEVFLLHFSFKLGVTITLFSCLPRYLKFDKILTKHL